MPAPYSLQILVVDDEQSIRKTLTLCLTGEGHRVTGVGTPADAVDQAQRRAFDLAFIDLRLGTANGLDLIGPLLSTSPWLRIVIITAHATIDTAVAAMRHGALDYLPKPFLPGQVIAMATRVGEMRALEHRLQTLQDDTGRSDGLGELTSACPAMQRSIALARQVADSDATVLLRGESGTGKGVLARAIHAWGARADKAFTVVSCPSLSAELLESELFGHVQGAFTGASRDHPGRIARGEGGTLFLDEIGDLPLALQPKLLRFLQDRAYERIGDTITRQADVRVIAATNLDLEDAVRAGRFREDLFYRLNVFQIELPPLRERLDDLATLSSTLLASLQGGKRILGFSPQASAALRSYAWPGNIRELRNVIERATILARKDLIETEHLPAGMAAADASPQLGDLVPLAAIEEQHIRRVLAAVPVLEEAARILDIDYATLWRRRKKYGL